MNPVSPLAAAESLTEFWSPRVISELDDHYIKVARLKGSLMWHSHDGEDELFFVLRGHLRIEMEHGEVALHAGDMTVIPKGVRHNPIADEEVLVMLVERKSTAHTGAEVGERTRSIADQLRPL